ncbi:MAG: fused MFS/spermidine synthase [Candidatus Hydrogenedentes bacterium]|nr:fused MFS/spermidine synthase [Candidatus Hydrogenedentota bacterium]
MRIVPIILTLGFVSGGVTLAYEVLWTRELLNLLGSTTRASTLVLAAFMAGIATGAWCSSRWLMRDVRPLWLFAIAEGTLAIIGFVFAQTFDPAAGLFPEIALSSAFLIALLSIPSFFMGIALPALAAALQGHGAIHPRYIAWLYGLNTLGGAIAALGVGFGALPTFGLLASEQGAAAIGLAAASVAGILALRRSPSSLPANGRDESMGTSGGTRLSRAAVMAALCLGGIAALGYQVLWTRILVLVVGSSSNAFAVMLGLYLLGLAIGALLIGHRLGRDRQPAKTFQYLQLAVATSAIIGIALFGVLPSAALFGFAWLGTAPWSIAIINASVAAVVILPPTIFIGASFPVAARLMVRGRSGWGREVGLALALTTAGNVGGILLTAFVVIPLLGLQRGVAVLALVNLAAALLLWVISRERETNLRYLVPLCVLGGLIAVPVLPSWDVSVMSSGVFRQAPVYLALLGSPERLDRAFSAYRTLYYREGSEAVVGVFDRPTLGGSPHRVLTIDGKVDASTGADMATQVLSGHLPFLFRPDARTALVIGLASGVTVGALAEYPLERIDVVEIEPAVIEASRAFDEISGAPLEDFRVNITVEDGRRYLQFTDQRFDVIVSEPSNPWLSMSARLFTREFFDLVRSRLAPRGVLVQWVPLYGLSISQFQTLLRTLMAVFPSISLFQVAEGDLVAVAGMEPLSVSTAALGQLFEGAPRATLERIGMLDPADLLARWLADEQGLKAVLGEGPVNTDDNGLLEFGSPWYLLTDTTGANRSIVEQAAILSSVPERLAEAWLPGAAALDRLKAVAARHLANGRTALVRAFADSFRTRGHRADADLLSGDAAEAEGKWAEAEAFWRAYNSPSFRLRRARLAFKLGRPAEAARLFEQTSAAERMEDDSIMFALALAGTDRAQQALSVLDTVSARTDSVAGIMAPFVKAVLNTDRGETDRALSSRSDFEAQLDGLRRCLESDGCRDVVDLLLAWSRTAPPGVSADSWEELRQAIYIRLTRPLPLYLRGVTQLWLGEPIAALASLQTYLKLIPAPDPRSKAHQLIASTRTR